MSHLSVSRKPRSQRAAWKTSCSRARTFSKRSLLLEGNCLSFVVSHTLAMGVPKRCRRSVIQNAIGHARAVFDSAYQNRARRWGIGPRCLAHRSSINDKSREPRGQQPSMRNQGTSSSETTHTVLLESRIIGLGAVRFDREQPPKGKHSN